MSERHVVDPTLELPDNTLIENVRFRHAYGTYAAGLGTVGEVRETTDKHC